MKLAGVCAVLLAVGVGVGACSCTGGGDVSSSPTTRVADPADAIDQELMIPLAQAKNLHHKAKIYTSDGNTAEAIASVRQILSLKFPPNAPEADDVRNDARALLAKLLVGQGQLDEAMRTVEEGLAASSRDSFFVANLYTVKGEIYEARAAADGSGSGVGAADFKREAISAYDKSIQINEALQKRLMEER